MCHRLHVRLCVLSTANSRNKAVTKANLNKITHTTPANIQLNGGDHGSVLSQSNPPPNEGDARQSHEGPRGKVAAVTLLFIFMLTCAVSMTSSAHQDSQEDDGTHVEALSAYLERGTTQDYHNVQMSRNAGRFVGAVHHTYLVRNVGSHVVRSTELSHAPELY